MFRVEKSTNRITKLKATRFSDLGLGERGDLQEWLAGTPEALGEDLLIIQKEIISNDNHDGKLADQEDGGSFSAARRNRLARFLA